MSTTKIVDFGSAQTLACRVMVNGDTAFFDPTDTTANIEAAIEAIGSMSGHSVTVTELTADREFQFAFDFTVTTFFAAKASDLGFSNPAAIDLSDASEFTTGVTGFPSVADGATLFFRYRNLVTSGVRVLASWGESDGSPVCQFYSYHNSFSAGYIDCGSVYGTFAAPNDTEWHTACIRIPDAVTLGHNALLSDVVLYLEGVETSISVAADGDFDWGTIDTFMIGDYFPSPGIYGITATHNIGHVLVFDSDIGDTAAKALNDYATAGAGCVMMLKGDEGTGTTVADSSGEGNGGTSSGDWVTDTTTTTITDGTVTHNLTGTFNAVVSATSVLKANAHLDATFNAVASAVSILKANAHLDASFGATVSAASILSVGESLSAALAVGPGFTANLTGGTPVSSGNKIISPYAVY